MVKRRTETNEQVAALPIFSVERATENGTRVITTVTLRVVNSFSAQHANCSTAVSGCHAERRGLDSVDAFVIVQHGKAYVLRGLVIRLLSRTVLPFFCFIVNVKIIGMAGFHGQAFAMELISHNGAEVIYARLGGKIIYEFLFVVPIPSSSEPFMAIVSVTLQCSPNLTTSFHDTPALSPIVEGFSLRFYKNEMPFACFRCQGQQHSSATECQS